MMEGFKNLIEVDENRAKTVFTILSEKWKKQEGIFSGVILPQQRYPLPQESNLAAHVLFYNSLPMRGAVISDEPFKWLNTLYSLHPTVFIPKEVIKWSKEDLLSAFKQASDKVLEGKGTGKKGLGAMSIRGDQLLDSWLKNSQVLVDNWGGSVLNIFDGIGDFETAFTRIDHRKQNGAGLVGIRRKIFSLFTSFLMEFRLIPEFPLPIPVDFHALRLLGVTGVIKFLQARPLKSKEDDEFKEWDGLASLRVSERLTDQISLWSLKFCNENGFSSRIINPAIWVLSRDLCSAHLQNRSRNKGLPIVFSGDLEKTPNSWPTKYRNLCGICPISQYCNKVTPSAPYYLRGLIIQDKRVPCPLPQTPDLPYLEAFLPPNRRRP